MCPPKAFHKTQVFNENLFTFPPHRRMSDLVLSHLYIHTANFFSSAYNVLSGKKHDFASREERSNEKQNSPGQMLP